MIRLKFACLATAAAVVWGGTVPKNAYAATVTFEGHSNTIFGDESIGNGLAVGSNSGYNFTSSGDHFHFLNSSSYPTVPQNGTGILLEDRNYSISMTESGGGSFSLQSMNYAGDSSNVAAATSLVVTGFFTAGGSTSTTLGLSGSTFLFSSLTGFTGLSSVVFDGTGGGGGFALDNLTVSAVPEPATCVLSSVGLISLFGCARRRH
jgi:hypothetical protein